MEKDTIRTTATNKRAAGTATVLVTVLTASVLLNMLLARKVASLRAQNNQITNSEKLQIGSSLPALTGYSVDGKSMAIGFGDVRVPTVIYVFSPQCGWCAKNIGNFRSLIAQAGGGYRVVGLATNRQDLSDYLRREQLNLPVIAGVDSALVGAYHLGATPTTIVISPEGKVSRVWTGAYQSNTRHEIESFLGVHLLPCCDGVPQESNTNS